MLQRQLCPSSSPRSEMVSPYYVEQIKRYGEVGLLKRRFECETLETADERYSKCIDEENTSRVALCKRGVRNRRSILRVWRTSLV